MLILTEQKVGAIWEHLSETEDYWTEN